MKPNLPLKNLQFTSTRRAYGGFLGMGQNFVAVPVDSLSYVEGQGHFVLNTTREKIQSPPLFSRKTLGDPEWAEDVYRYFGQQPYWTEEK